MINHCSYLVNHTQLRLIFRPGTVSASPHLRCPNVRVWVPQDANTAQSVPCLKKRVRSMTILVTVKDATSSFDCCLTVLPLLIHFDDWVPFNGWLHWASFVDSWCQKMPQLVTKSGSHGNATCFQVRGSGSNPPPVRWFRVDPGLSFQHVFQVVDSLSVRPGADIRAPWLLPLQAPLARCQLGHGQV